MLKTQQLLQYLPLYPVLSLLGAYTAHAIAAAPACSSAIYCTGDLLQTIQLMRIYPDSKSFVDLRLIHSPNDTLADFERLMQNTNGKPSRDLVSAFIKSNFIEGNELQNWLPPDFDPEPPFLVKIKDKKLRNFAKSIVAIWAQLGRRVDPDVARYPDNYSFLFVNNGFIVPGGRFKEIYYWDSYWIIRGLLISNMTETAKGMIENLLHLVDKFGYIPNGSRVYYLGRSQPPLLAAMVSEYFTATGNVTWLAQHIATVEKELQYWLDRKKVTVNIKGKRYILLRYMADKSVRGPRPESYYEDYMHAQKLPSDEKREQFYSEMKSAAESGWDFSTRWFVTAADGTVGNITDVHATRILPVDLNSIFAGALQLAGNFQNTLGNNREANKWWSLAKYWRGSIDAVFWDPRDGVWYDYDAQARSHRRHFYPSCVTPLWAGAIDESQAPAYAARLVRYLQSSSALDFPGGVPTSMSYSGEQWDYPNAWPPLQSMLIGGLEASGHDEARKLAKQLAGVWIRANYIGYSDWHKMFEKYSAVQPGHQGGGGEYVVQDGFGWTNGIVLELLDRYGNEIELDGLSGRLLLSVQRV